MNALGRRGATNARWPAARLALVTLATALAGAGTAWAAPISLLPQYGSNTATSPGAQAAVHQIDGSWQGSTVLWNENTLRYGSGAPIGSFAWGTGLWGQADWQAVQNAAAGAAGPAIVNSWTGWVPTISFGNNAFNDTYGDNGSSSLRFGSADVVPLFTEPGGNEENWTTAFSGVFRVSEAGLYNFSVLNDDGFFLRLIGADGQSHEIGRDFLNDPARSSFGDGLLLSEGLYGFELGEWNRLGVGVVDFRWNRGGDTAWELVPTERLGQDDVGGPGDDTHGVDEPATLALALAAVGLLAGLRRRVLAKGS